MSIEDLQSRLNKALLTRSTEDVRVLLAEGADPNLEVRLADGQIIQAPMLVATKRDVVANIELLHASGGRLEEGYTNDTTPLLFAAAYGSENVGRWLIHHGVDATRKDNVHHSALSRALQYGKCDFADMLLWEEPRCRGEHLMEAAQMVIDLRSLQVAQWLLGKGVSPDLKDRVGSPWLCLAQSSKERETQLLAKLLLDAGAKVNLANGAENTALHLAVKLGNAVSVLQLLRAGADPDRPGWLGLTARKEILELDEDSDVRVVFAAWDASEVAQRIISDCAEQHVSDGSKPSSLKSL